MAKTLYQPFYWDDYFLDTPELDLHQHGAYLCLIGLYWQNGGPLPNDLPRLQRILRATTKKDGQTLKFILQKHFTLNTHGAWAHERIDRDIEKLQHYRNAQTEKSQKAVHARKGKSATHQPTGKPVDAPTDTPTGQSTDNPMVDPEGGEAKAKANTGIINTLTPHNPPEGVSEVLTPFDDFWNGYPKGRRHNKARCLTIWRSKRLDEKADEVLAGLAAWCRGEGWQKQGGKFVPYPQKFLNEAYWENPPEAADGGGMSGLIEGLLSEGGK